MLIALNKNLGQINEKNIQLGERNLHSLTAEGGWGANIWVVVIRRRTSSHKGHRKGTSKKNTGVQF